MPEPQRLVINTGPLIALVAALDELSVLEALYQEVLVPFEVSREMRAAGHGAFAAQQFEEARWLTKKSRPMEINPLLANSLDAGEAAVIQLALNEEVSTVAIDETVGRRVAKLSGLQLTGSIGILLRARREGFSFSIRSALERMRTRGVWLSQQVVDYALRKAGEHPGNGETSA